MKGESRLPSRKPGRHQRRPKPEEGPKMREAAQQGGPMGRYQVVRALLGQRVTLLKDLKGFWTCGERAVEVETREELKGLWYFKKINGSKREWCCENTECSLNKKKSQTTAKAGEKINQTILHLCPDGLKITRPGKEKEKKWKCGWVCLFLRRKNLLARCMLRQSSEQRSC